MDLDSEMNLKIGLIYYIIFLREFNINSFKLIINPIPIRLTRFNELTPHEIVTMILTIILLIYSVISMIK